ncbi:(2Fe-2S)-binding protein [Acetobacter sp. AN02]|uniref:(2Fe-2S)-binding protein n=1 Tax=Acetobacter sp. AN02 TaxID=2894186 RepID=UPI0024341F1C|nr:(2Fe-2S)-binding protein [Acetobacter sp. AN02]MDG6093890.1 (2Fe-2S)-binding protein [Acetobacter sp. AN02]
MFICSCNALTDKDVHQAIADGATRMQQIYEARKCQARCGNCVPGVLCLLKKALQEKKAAAATAPVPVPTGLLVRTDPAVHVAA